MSSSPGLTALKDWLAGRAFATPGEISRQLGISPATLSRRLNQFPPGELLRFGRTRSLRYAVARTIPGWGSQWPLHALDANATPILLGRLAALPHRAFAVIPSAEAPAWPCSGGEGDGIYPELPWYLQDLRPQGFLGRALVRRLAAPLGLPIDTRTWTSDDALRALLACGSDLPGDLVLGESAMAGAIGGPSPPVTPRSAYPDLATAAHDGVPSGSSVAGEQQKFTAYAEVEGGARHVIVKFASLSGENGARWCDLLWAEHAALETAAAHGLAAAKSRVFDLDGRRFLEVERFDRVGATGRRSAFSLTHFDAEFAGVGSGWHRAARRLAAGGRIDAASARDAERAEAFGVAIANHDRHFGNLSFGFDDSGPARLRPIYDMLPMFFAPAADGPRPYVEPRVAFPADLAADAVAWAKRAAVAFWARLGGEPRISEGLRAVAAAIVAGPALRP